MPYTITLSDTVTTLVTVLDKAIIGPLEINTTSNCSLNLVGRGASNYGLAYATNFVWLLQNFANSAAPVSPISGQLWYNNTANASTLQLFNSNNQWVQVATSDAPFSIKGDLTVSDNLGDSATIGANGVITLIRADYKPRIVFEGEVSGVPATSNAVTLQLSTDSFGNPDLSISSPAFASAGFLWHSQNLSPITVNGNNVITGNNIFTGFNTFTNTTNFSEIIVSNNPLHENSATAITDITGGVVNLKNYSANLASITWWSNAVGNTDNVSMTYSDPSIVTLNFNETIPTKLVLTPSTTQPTDHSSLSHTVYHTGNLSPVVTNPTSAQNISGNLNLVGSSNLAVGGTLSVTGNATVALNLTVNQSLTTTGMIYGNGGGAFVYPLTVNGSEVLTAATSGFLPLTGGTLSGSLVGTTATFSGGVTGDVLVTKNASSPYLSFQNSSSTQLGYIQYSTTDNNLYFVNGSGYCYIDSGGNFHSATGIFSTNFTSTSGLIFANNGNIEATGNAYAGPGGTGGVYGAVVGVRNSDDPTFCLQDITGTVNYGSLSYYNVASAPNSPDYCVYLKNGPTGYIKVDAAGNLTAGGQINSFGDITANGNGARLRAAYGVYGSTGLSLLGNDLNCAPILLDFGLVVDSITNGYQALPSGLIIQWGLYLGVGTVSNYAAGINTTFPRACFIAGCSYAAAPSSGETCGAQPNNGAANLYSILVGNTGVSNDIFWWAIGY